MDRHGNKEIKSMAAVLGCVMAGILLLSSVYLVYRYEERNRQAAQLALRYPWSEGVWIEIREAKNTADTQQADREKQKELQEKYGYYFFSAKESKEILLLFASEILIIAGIFAGAVFFIRKRAKTEENLERAQIKVLEDSMERFMDGNFDTTELLNIQSDYLWGLREKEEKLGTYIENMKERLEQEESSTKALITDISHQLKTPFAAFRVCYEMMEDDTLTEEEGKEFYIQGKQELENLGKLMELLLNMSRLEGSMIHLEPQVRSLKKTILGAVNTVIMKAVDKNIELSAELEDCYSNHDFRWTQEAMINVLDNAIKYSKPGKKVEIRMRKLTSYVLIEVFDEGIGIPRKDRNKIFQRFYRGEEAREMERDGAGVGLYLARQILEQQGGTICVKDRSGILGSCFHIMLPLAEA